MDEVSVVAKSAECDELQIMEGDPTAFAATRGFQCLRDDGSALVLRVSDQSDATAKAMNDWADTVNDENQIIYSGEWFATGPPDWLHEVFDRYEHVGPTGDPPKKTPLTASEQNIAVCSSLLYFVTGEVLRADGDLAAGAEYLEQYPQFKRVVEKVVAEVGADPQASESIDNDLRRDAYLTHYDDEFKEACHSSE